MVEQSTEPSIFDEAKAQYYFSPASAGARFGNYFFDVILYGILYYLMSSQFIPLLDKLGDGMVISRNTLMTLWYTYSFLISCLSATLYYTLLEGLTQGKTIGKYVTKTRVVKEDGSPITIKDALRRSLVRLIPFEAFSTFSEHPWHDRWTKTMVMKESDLAEFRALESL